jgi:GNAT superfamily N-acetyltransferase
VVLSREADEAWLSRYRRKGVSDVALRVLGSGSPRASEAERGAGPSVWFATVPGAQAPAAKEAHRPSTTHRPIAAVEVDPGQRRRGLATEVMAALARRALDEGASAAWLQVETDNAGARALYAGMGFSAHHAYHHYRAPEDAAGAGRG